MRLTTNHLFWLISLALFGASVFFTVSITSFKKELNLSQKTFDIKSGEEALVVKVIDGDEVSVMMNNQQVIVRILGILSFDTSVNDPLFQNIAQSSFLFLKNSILNKKVTIVFHELKKDSSNRFLAYLHREDIDIGQKMISKGLTLVYTKYPFSRQDEYLAIEESAKSAKAGLWGDPNIIERSMQLKNKWRIERVGD